MNTVNTNTLRTSSLSRVEWYDAAATFSDFGYRHAWDFNVHASRRQGSEVEHVALTHDDGPIVGLASVRVRRIPLVGTGVAYVGGGPLTRRDDPDDLERLGLCLDALRTEYVTRRGLTLRISPPVVVAELLGDYTSVYRDAGFGPTLEAPIYRTLLLDLGPPLDEIRADLARRWRRDLNKSERSDFEVEAGTGTELFGRFRELFESFVEWKDFEVEHDARFHEVVNADLPDNARYLVILSTHDGELAGGLVVARTGDTGVYVLGASNPELRKLSPGHFLQWQAITRLKEEGLARYDLGGIDPDDNPGGHLFKSGITKNEATAPGPFECSPGGLRAGLTRLAEIAHRRLARRG
jgi:hypothetical protein